LGRGFIWFPFGRSELARCVSCFGRVHSGVLGPGSPERELFVGFQARQSNELGVGGDFIGGERDDVSSIRAACLAATRRPPRTRYLRFGRHACRAPRPCRVPRIVALARRIVDFRRYPAASFLRDILVGPSPNQNYWHADAFLVATPDISQKIRALLKSSA
jgi:hypothetical protein